MKATGICALIVAAIALSVSQSAAGRPFAKRSVRADADASSIPAAQPFSYSFINSNLPEHLRVSDNAVDAEDRDNGNGTGELQLRRRDDDSDGDDTLPYHGGAIAGSKYVNVYFIFYGDSFAQSCDQNGVCLSSDIAVLNTYYHMAETQWFNTLAQFSDTTGEFVQPRIHLRALLYDNSTTSFLTGIDVNTYIFNAAQNSFGGVDPNGVYVFHVGQSVQEVYLSDSINYPNQFGAYHFNFTVNGVSMRYMFVGEYSVSYLTGHEFAEFASDPDLTAYYNGQLNADYSGIIETADLCEDEPAVTLNSAPGAPYYSLDLPPLYSPMDHACIGSTVVPDHTCTSRCPAGSSIYQNQQFLPGSNVTSPNGNHIFTFTEHGHAHLSKVGSTKVTKALWSASTNPFAASSLVLKASGNLFAYSQNITWRTDTGFLGSGTSCLTLRNDGRLAVYDHKCVRIYPRLVL